MDDLFDLSGPRNNDEDDDYEHNDDSMILGKLQCYRKARTTCNVILKILQRNRITSLRIILVASKQKYKNFVRRFRHNNVYRDMLSFVRQIVMMYNHGNFDGMKQVLIWKIREYDTEMGDLNTIVNHYVENNAFNDVTRTTINESNIVYNDTR